MDSKEKRRHDCQRKRQYFTRHKARQSARFAKGNYGDKMYVYKCDLCRNYHLTRTDPKLSQIERLALKSANVEASN